MCNALGIVTSNDPNVYVRGLQKYRPIAAFNFIGRYRLVDFPLSNMANSGIHDIKVFVNGNPRSLIDHIGSGRQYNINSKHGKIELIPLYREDGSVKYVSDVQSYYDQLYSIEQNNNDYVIIAPVNMIYMANYADLLDQHMESGAEITMLYQNVDNAKDHYINCDVIQMNRQKGVLSIESNLGNYKNRQLSLQTYIMSKEIFVSLVKEATKVSSMYWFKDIVNDHCKDMDIRGVNFRGGVYCINDLKSYFDSNMAILDEANMREFSNPKWPAYTRTNDSAPAIYLNGGSAVGSFVSNSCEVHGQIVNSIVGRACKIGKNSVVENCLIMPGVTIGDNAVLKNVIVDKYAKIVKKKDLAGTEEEPLYIGRRENI